MSVALPESPSQTVDVTAHTFEAVLFDLDGTLIDSTGAVERSWITWSAARGVGPVDVEANHGRPAQAIVADHVPAHEVDEALADFQRLELADLADVVPLPGALALLAAAGPRGAIATSSTRQLADSKLRVSGITAPSVVVTFDDVEQGKPHPEPFLLAAKLLGVDPERCLVVEDAPAGIAAASAAGCRSLAVAGTHTPDQLTDADVVVDSLADVALVADGAGLRLVLDAL